jgi:hypothetical protein
VLFARGCLLIKHNINILHVTKEVIKERKKGKRGRIKEGRKKKAR